MKLNTNPITQNPVHYRSIYRLSTSCCFLPTIHRHVEKQFHPIKTKNEEYDSL